MTLNFKKFSITLFLGYMLTTPAMAADIWMAYQDALAEDPTFKAAIALRNSTDEALPFAIGDLLPLANVSATTVNQETLSGSKLLGSFNTKEYGYSFTAQQVIVDVSKWAAVAAAKHVKCAADATAEAAYQDLLLRLSTAYFAVLSAEDNLVFVVAKKQAIGKQLETTNQQFNVGVVAKTEVADSQASYDSVVADELNARNDLANRKEDLRKITGQQYPSLAKLRTKLRLLPPLPAIEEEWVQIAKDNSPTLRSAKFTVDANQSTVKQAWAGHLPTLSASGSKGQSRLGTINDSAGPWVDTWSYGLSFNLPLFAGGKTQSGVRKAQYNLDQSQDLWVQTARATEGNTRSSYRGVLNDISRAKAFAQAVKSGDIAFQATQASYEVGTKTSTDVLNSISNLYQQKLNYAKSRYDYIITLLTLKAAAGVLTADDIKMVNMMLESDTQAPSEYKGTPIEDTEEEEPRV
jgi:outer membrane protein